MVAASTRLPASGAAPAACELPLMPEMSPALSCSFWRAENSKASTVDTREHKRWYVGRQEWVPYKLCQGCRARNASGYSKAKDRIVESRKLPENRKRANEVRSTEISRERHKNQRTTWASTDHGREVIRHHQVKRQDEIRESTCLRIEQTLAASIRGRLKGVRHGESANMSNYSEFVDHDDVVDHFKKHLKPQRPWRTTD
eukprot:471588-Prymnesium_polylepis.1